MDDFAVYNGQKIDLRRKMMEILTGMNSIKEFRGMVSIPRFRTPATLHSVPRLITTLTTFLSLATTKIPEFEKTAFRDPFMIAYSSGTTGVPKCIVHSVGGALVSSAKETILHSELTPESVALQYTTTGWIMYFNSVMNLLPGARVVLYDGSPFQPDATTFLSLLSKQKVTMLGTSPRWLSELQKKGIVPKDVADLSTLHTVTSTGMLLSDQQFEWFYDIAFPKEVLLANISGGTDIVSLPLFNVAETVN
jgi:acetoacetyl-CoA synthetase